MQINRDIYVGSSLVELVPVCSDSPTCYISGSLFKIPKLVIKFIIVNPISEYI